MCENQNEETVIPLKEIVPFEVFQAIFEQMMENEDRRRDEGDSPGRPPVRRCSSCGVPIRMSILHKCPKCIKERAT